MLPTVGMVDHMSTYYVGFRARSREAIKRNTFAFLPCMEILSMHRPTWNEPEKGNVDEDVVNEAAEYLLMECMPANRMPYESSKVLRIDALNMKCTSPGQRSCQIWRSW